MHGPARTARALARTRAGALRATAVRRCPEVSNGRFRRARFGSASEILEAKECLPWSQLPWGLP